MSTEIINNFTLQKSSPIDARLEPVSTVGALPNIASTLLYQGAEIYVINEKSYYRVEDVSGTLTWVKQNSQYVIGTITVLNTDVNMDLSMVTPAIATCDEVLITVSGGSTMTCNHILNFPANKEIKFIPVNGDTIVFKHVDYNIAGSTDVVSEVGLDISITGRSSASDFLILALQGCIKQIGATQYMSAAQFAQNLVSVVVEDNLISTATNRALSANQGRILNDTKQTKLTIGNNLASSTLPDGTIKLDSLSPDFYNSFVATLSDAELVSMKTLGVDVVLASKFTAPINYAYNIVADLDLTAKNISYGLWILPAGKEASNQGNWKKLTATKDLDFARMKIAIPNTDLSFWSSLNYKVPLSMYPVSVGNLPIIMHPLTLPSGFINASVDFEIKNAMLGDFYEITVDINYTRSNTITTEVLLTLKNTSVTITDGTITPSPVVDIDYTLLAPSVSTSIMKGVCQKTFIVEYNPNYPRFYFQISAGSTGQLAYITLNSSNILIKKL